MPDLAELRLKYPQYGDMSDQQFADAFHQKFYADMPREDFNKKLGVGTSATGKIPSPEPMGAGERFMTGMGDPLIGGTQLLTHATGSPEDIAKVDAQVKQREAEIQRREGGGLVRGLGGATMLAPLAAAGPLGAAAGLPSMVGAAAGGAAAGLLQPATKERGFLEQKVEDALLGSAFGLGTSAAGSVLGPAVRPDAKTLIQSGVKLTPGQMVGGLGRRAEEVFKSIPILGSFIRGAEGRGIEGFNRAVINQALEPIGQKLSAKTAMGRDAIAEAKQHFNNAYDTLLPTLQLKLDTQLANDVANARFMSTELPGPQREQFNQILTNRLAPFFQRSPMPARQGPTLKETESAIRNIADSYRSSGDSAQRNMARLLDDVRGSLRDALIRQNPQQGRQLAAIDQGYAMFARAEGAASRRATSDGIFTPNDLLSTIKSQDKSVRKGAFARGDALMQTYAEAAQRVLPSKVPDSGTAERAMFAGLAAGGLEYGVRPEIMAGLGAASLPYTRPGMAALNALAQPGPVRAGVGAGIRAAAPLAEPLGKQATYGGPQQ